MKIYRRSLTWLFITLFSAPILAQENLNENVVEAPNFEKGQMFVFWGWNRAVFSNSDIRFKGEGYDFSLLDVKAHDNPATITYDNYLKPDRLTIPQTNARIGYFIKDDVAVVLALDHMKYVMDQNQKAEFRGHISDPEFASKVVGNTIDLSDESFLTFEHTDGLNYVNVGLEKYKPLIQKKNLMLHVAYGAGAGVLYPKSNVKLFGNPRSDRFHVAGFGTDARTSLNMVAYKHVLLRVEGKVGYANMMDIKTTLNNKPDKAQQDFVYAQLNFGIGYTFRTKKNI